MSKSKLTDEEFEAMKLKLAQFLKRVMEPEAQIKPLGKDSQFKGIDYPLNEENERYRKLLEHIKF